MPQASQPYIDGANDSRLVLDNLDTDTQGNLPVIDMLEASEAAMQAAQTPDAFDYARGCRNFWLEWLCNH